MKNACAIAGVGLSDFGQICGRSVMSFTLQACKRAVEDAGLDRRAIDGVLVCMPACMGEQHGWATRVAAHLGLTPRLAATMDMGGATPIGMIQTAALYIQAGMASQVLCAAGMQNNPQGVPLMLMGSQFAFPYGDIGAITFMAHVARRQMHEHGLTGRHYGEIAATFRAHAGKNPRAQKRTPMTVEDHQASPWVVEPLRKYDCCLVTDFGGAVVVTSLARARDLAQPPAVIAGAGQEHGAEMILPAPRGERLPGAGAARDAFAMAGIGPHEVDAAYLYDGFTPLVVHELQAFGFCPRGEVGAFLESGALRLGGALPTNTHGGLLSEGHTFGVGHIAEAVRQLRGICGERQIAGAEAFFVHGFGGAPHEAPPTASYATLVLTRDG
jgi:acetyl-CoA acetyltransferase